MAKSSGPLIEQFTAVGIGNDYIILTEACFNVSRYNSGAGTVILERSFDEGATWHTVHTMAANFEGVGREIDTKVWYRFNCTVYTSGTIDVRLSRGKL